MSNYLLYPILELKGYIITVLAVLIALTAVAFSVMGGRKRTIKSFRWLALLPGRTVRELIFLSLCLSEVCFVVSVILFSDSMEQVQMVFLALLCLAKGLCFPSPGNLAGEALYGILTAAALTAANLLWDYMQETGAELYLGIVWGLLLLFVLQYSIYYLFRSVERMLAWHEKAGKKHRAEA